VVGVRALVEAVPGGDRRPVTGGVSGMIASGSLGLLGLLLVLSAGHRRRAARSSLTSESAVN